MHAFQLYQLHLFWGDRRIFRTIIVVLKIVDHYAIFAMFILCVFILSQVPPQIISVYQQQNNK